MRCALAVSAKMRQRQPCTVSASAVGLGNTAIPAHSLFRIIQGRLPVLIEERQLQMALGLSSFSSTQKPAHRLYRAMKMA